LVNDGKTDVDSFDLDIDEALNEDDQSVSSSAPIAATEPQKKKLGKTLKATP